MPTLDLYAGIVGQAFAEPGDEHVEAATHEIVVVAPNSPENIVAPDEGIQSLCASINFRLGIPSKSDRLWVIRVRS